MAVVIAIVVGIVTFFVAFLVIGTLEQLSKNGTLSFRTAFQKFKPVLYIVSILSIVIGYYFIPWLFLLGIVLFAGTLLGKFICWLLKPIVFHVKIVQDDDEK